MKEFKRAALVFLVFSIITGLAYPLIITGLSQTFFPYKANGSLVRVGDRTVGSELVGQKFSSTRYFHGRPSANDYDASNSGGTNFGPASEKYLAEVVGRIKAIRTENGLSSEASVPADLVLASGSGLDADISLEAAVLQAPRVARARGLPADRVMNTVQTMAEHVYPKGWARVNVLKLNLALDRLER
jgi:potassium-transporting ATPase KdpC subunit